MHEDLALATLDLAEPHDAVDLTDRRGILRTPSFKQLGDSRQTARDIARLRRFLRNPREHFTDRHGLTVLHRNDRAQLERDVDR